MGFFDMTDDQNQGLMAFAANLLQNSGPSTTPTSFGQALGSGLGAYQKSMTEAERRKLEKQLQQQQLKIGDFKLRDAESDFANQERARQEALRVQQVLSQLGGGQSDLGRAQSVLGSNLAPTVQNAQALEQAPAGAAAQDEYSMLMSQANALRAAGLHGAASQKALEALKFREEYSTTPQPMVGPDGKLGNYQLAKYGSPARNVGLGVKPEMVATSLGGTTRWDDKNALTPGQQFAHTQSPDNKATVGASYANAAATREIATATRDAANIQRNQATEMKLGDDYRTQSKSFKEVGDAYRQINATLDKASTSPAATLAAATKFMKLLDPGSVVRESELGMALAASGVIDRATNYYQTLLKGRVLTPDQVKDFKDITKQIYGAAQASQKAIDQNYRGQAKTYGLRPEMIIQDLGQGGTGVIDFGSLK